MLQVCLRPTHFKTASISTSIISPKRKEGQSSFHTHMERQTLFPLDLAGLGWSWWALDPLRCQKMLSLSWQGCGDSSRDFHVSLKKCDIPTQYNVQCSVTPAHFWLSAFHILVLCLSIHMVAPSWEIGDPTDTGSCLSLSYTSHIRAPLFLLSQGFISSNWEVFYLLRTKQHKLSGLKLEKCIP